jgi:riboflavin kinase / FMN adenylyltransferase
MELIRRLHPRRPQPQCVVTIGTFDGLHLGHQALIERVLARAAASRLPAMMVSFEPTPREFLQARDPPARLTNFRERWRLLSDLGLARLWLLPFDATLRSRTGAQFMELLRAAGARQIVVGHDFRFGHGGQANAAWCAAQGPVIGIEVEIVAPVLLDGLRVSSGLVREALAAGDLARAARLLGRRYSMRGRVHRGQGLGRKLGFATANLPVQRLRTALSGVFAVRVHGAPRPNWPGVASLGTRPTVNGVEPLLEVHLFDVADDLYGSELEVEFVSKLRDEVNFGSLDELVAQMHRDAAQARAALMTDREVS